MSWHREFIECSSLQTKEKISLNSIEIASEYTHRTELQVSHKELDIGLIVSL